MTSVMPAAAANIRAVRQIDPGALRTVISRYMPTSTVRVFGDGSLVRQWIGAEREIQARMPRIAQDGERNKPGAGSIDGSSDKQSDGLESGLPVSLRNCGRAAIRAKDGSIVSPAPGMVRSPVHAEQIRTDHGYQVFTDPIAGCRFSFIAALFAFQHGTFSLAVPILRQTG